MKWKPLIMSMANMIKNGMMKEAALPDLRLARARLHDRHRQLNDGKRQFFAVRPLVAHQAVDAEHGEADQRDQHGPGGDIRPPERQLREKVGERVAAVAIIGELVGVFAAE